MRKTALIVLIILALGLIGASLSALYEHDERFGTMLGGTFKVSYGFPFGWHGYSDGYGPPRVFPSTPPPADYWFSLESFLLDVAFWSVISSLAVLTTCFIRKKLSRNCQLLTYRAIIELPFQLFKHIHQQKKNLD